jgi:hypothetical protein
MTDADTESRVNPHDWTSVFAQDLRAIALRRPWGKALMAIGLVHFGFFLICQGVYTIGDRSPGLALVLWASEVFCVFWAMRAVAGRDWIKESPTIGLIVRVWITFLILSFNVVTLNHLTGWSVDWFKPVWCTLATFGFATMAWLFGYRLLIPAVQMYFTGLLMVRFPAWNYLIHGASWCLALQYVGWDLIQRQARLMAASVGEGEPGEEWSSGLDVRDRESEAVGERR